MRGVMEFLSPAPRCESYTYCHPIKLGSEIIEAQPEKPEIKIWNPAVAVNWSFLLTPAFGSVIHYLNWKSLGEEQRQFPALIWAAVFCFLVAISLLDLTGDSNNGVYLGAFVLLFVWYFAAARAQIRFVSERFGKDYPRQDWFPPIMIALGIMVGSSYLPVPNSPEVTIPVEASKPKAGEAIGLPDQQLVVGWRDNSRFTPEFVILNTEAKTITLRLGEQFWPTKSIQVSLGEPARSGSSFTLDRASVFVREKLSDSEQDLPESHYVSGDVSGSIVFGEFTETAVPVEVNLVVKGERDNMPDEYRVSGTGYATMSEYKMAGSTIDRSHDSWDTLIYITRDFLQQKHKSKVSIVEEYHKSISARRDVPFPQEAEFAFRYEVGDIERDMKVQLYKNEAGWKIHRELSKFQVFAAHPVLPPEETEERSRELRALAVLVGQRMERELIEEKLAEQVKFVDFSLFDCRSHKKHGTGLCAATLHIEHDGENYCQTRKYALRHEQGSWQVKEKVDSALEYDYKTGGLKPIEDKETESLPLKLFLQLFERC
jgi:hypothetical protein